MEVPELLPSQKASADILRNAASRLTSLKPDLASWLLTDPAGCQITTTASYRRAAARPPSLAVPKEACSRVFRDCIPKCNPFVQLCGATERYEELWASRQVLEIARSSKG